MELLLSPPASALRRYLAATRQSLHQRGVEATADFAAEPICTSDCQNQDLRAGGAAACQIPLRQFAILGPLPAPSAQDPQDLQRPEHPQQHRRRTRWLGKSSA